MELLDEIKRRNIPDEVDPITAGAEEDDYSPEMARAAVDKFFELGSVRERELNQHLEEKRDGRYEIPYSGSGQYADFSSIANARYLKKKYPWLTDGGGWIGIDRDDKIDEHGSFEAFLRSIPHEDWVAFLEDLGRLEDYPYLDEEAATELEMEETDRWMTEDGVPELIKALISGSDDAYDAYLFSKITPELIFEWSRATDHYPESQGDGSVWMNMKQLADLRETQTWFIDNIEDDHEGWALIKNTFYESKGAEAFDRMLRRLAGEDEECAHAYNKADNLILREWFLHGFRDDRIEQEAPTWYFDKPTFTSDGVWVAGYSRDEYDAGQWTPPWESRYQDGLDYLQHADWFKNIVGGWFRRPPKEHPEFTFENQEDDIEPSSYISDLPDRKQALKALVAARTCTQVQAVEYAIMCAEEVLFIWEEAHPEDDRPRKAIEATRAWLAEPTEARREAANSAAAADDAAAAAHAASAAYYAYYAADAGVATAISYSNYAEYSANAALEEYRKRKRKPVREAQEDDLDSPEMVIKGGVSEDIVYEDELIRVLSPRNLDALNYHLVRDGRREIANTTWTLYYKNYTVLVFLGKEPQQQLLPDAPPGALKELGVVKGDPSGFVVYTGSTTETKLADLLADPTYGHSMRKAIILKCREMVANDDAWGVALLQVGGLAELRRANRRGYLELDKYKIVIGLQYVKRRQLALAAKAFGRDKSTMTNDGVWLVYDGGVSSLTDLFKNSESASQVFSYETYDWVNYRSSDIEVDEVLERRTPDVMKHLREIMVNRKVWSPDAGADQQGDYFYLTPKTLKDYDDATLINWLTNPNQEDIDDGTFDDIIEALQDCGARMLETASQDKLYNVYYAAVSEALESKEDVWDKFPSRTKGSSTYCAFVSWKTIIDWSSNFTEAHGYIWDDSLEQLPINVLSDTIDMHNADYSADWRDVDKSQCVTDSFDALFELDAPDDAPAGHPAYIDPQQVELPLKESDEDDIDPSSYVSDLPDRKQALKSLVNNRTCTKAQAVEYAIMCAEEVLFIWEEKYPKDDRPRKAIEAARAWLAEPTEARREAAYSAAYAADAAEAAANAARAAYANAAVAATAAAATAAAAYYAAYAEHSANAALKNYKKCKNIREEQEDDLDSPEMMTKLKSGIPVELERLGTQCIKDNAANYAVYVSDIQFELVEPDLRNITIPDDAQELYIRFKPEGTEAADAETPWSFWSTTFKQMDNLVRWAYRDRMTTVHASYIKNCEDTYPGFTVFFFVLRGTGALHPEVYANVPF